VIVQRNMKHVYWMLRNLQLILKNLGAVRDHPSPNADTLKRGVTGRQIAAIAVDKYHFKGTPKPTGRALDALAETMTEEELDKMLANRAEHEVLEALMHIAHSDIFKRPPWFTFASSIDVLDKYVWSLPPDFE